MNRTEFVTSTAAAVLKANPHLTAKQAAVIAERIATREDASIMPLWAYEKAELRDEFTTLAVTATEKAESTLFRKAPTRAQYVALQVAEIEAKLGRPATATERLNFARAAADLSPDDLLERIPADTKLPEPAAPKIAQSAPIPKDDVAALDAEVERRWGKKPAELMAGDRRRYHDILKNEQRREASAARNRESALAHVDGDFGKLPPAERIARFRAAEKAKNGA